MEKNFLLILASASPRRHEILARAGYPHCIRTADTDETLPAGIRPENAVCTLSRRKAEAIPCGAGEILLAADTVVSLEGKILGKPADAEEAAAMLRSLSGRSHDVFTGVTVKDAHKTVTFYERTAVRFRTLSDAEIAAYIATGDPLDKAGAYGYQSLAGIFVAGIEGDYYNVVGLPLCAVSTVLRTEFGVLPDWQ